MVEGKEAFVGIDVAKLRNAVAIADAGRDGEVRFYGEVDASPDSIHRLAAKLAGKHQRLHFATRPGRPGTGSTGCSPGSGIPASWSRRRWSRGSRATGSRPTAATRSPWPASCAPAS